MVPAASRTDAESQHQQQQQQQQHEVSQSPPVVDDYYSDWTGNRAGAINEPELAKDNMIDGHALVNEVNDIERQVPQDIRPLESAPFLELGLGLQRARAAVS